MLGIIGAMEIEIESLKKIMTDKKSDKIGNLEIITGKISGKDVCLSKCGIGKVNASVCAAALILKYGADKIINTGVAGGIAPDSRVLDVYTATGLIEHDFDLTSFGKKKGQHDENDFLAYKPDMKISDKLYEIGKSKGFSVKKGIIVSGDQFISDKEKSVLLNKDFDAAGVEMEGAAIAHTCYKLGVPFAVLRTISDSANDEAKTTFEENCAAAALISTDILKECISEM